ncbi:hypothetical protein [Thalassoglobus sp.]
MSSLTAISTIFEKLMYWNIFKVCPVDEPRCHDFIDCSPQGGT